MKRRQLKQEIIEKIKRDLRLQAELSPALGKLRLSQVPVSGVTLTRYLYSNHPLLSSKDVLEVISPWYDIPVEDLTEEVEMTDTTTVY